MDVRLAVASKRDLRDYAVRPVPEEVRRRILEAGRVAGSGRNRQPWRFLVLESAPVVDRVAAGTTSPGNLRRAPFVVAIAVRGPGLAPFDAGRAAQNMMLSASAEGVGSCPTGVLDPGAAEPLGLAEDERLLVILCFGYPARRRDPGRRSADEWVRRANRRPYDEVVTVL